MKKILCLTILTMSLIIGCGEKVELTTEAEKKELLHKVFVEKNEASIKKYQEIQKKLDSQRKKGNKVALEELEKWNKAESAKKADIELEKEAEEARKYFESIRVK